MVIRKCTEKDRDILMEFLSKDPSFNLFTIGDIENFGFNVDFQEIWMEMNEDGEIVSCLLRYEGGFIPTAYGPYNVNAYIEIIENHPSTMMISGKKTTVDFLLKRLAEPGRKPKHFILQSSLKMIILLT